MTREDFEKAVELSKHSKYDGIWFAEALRVQLQRTPLGIKTALRILENGKKENKS